MTEKISAAEYAHTRGIPESAVVHRIKSGIYDGVEEDGEWFVVRAGSPAGPAPVPEGNTPEQEPPLPAETKKVARYTSRAYVNSIMILLGGLVAADLISFLFNGEAEAFRGLGLRIGIIVLLWTQHKWARLAVQVWAGLLTIIGASGLFWLFSADPAEYTVAWWGPLMFSSFLVIGLGYLLTAHRYIKVEEVPA